MGFVLPTHDSFSNVPALDHYAFHHFENRDQLRAEIIAAREQILSGTHVQNLQTRAGGFIPAIVTEGDLRDAVYWHQNIHLPFIATSPTFRLDRHWNWPRLVFWTYIIEKLMGRNTAFFQINVATPSGNALPVGQLLVSDGYPFFPRLDEPSIFLWYLAAAPLTALHHHKISADFKLLRVLVDIAIQFSFQRGYDGRLTLHAASSGVAAEDKNLYDKYCAIGLTPYAPHLPIRYVRRNDGRYFYADELSASRLSAALDPLR